MNGDVEVSLEAAKVFASSDILLLGNEPKQLVRKIHLWRYILHFWVRMLIYVLLATVVAVIHSKNVYNKEIDK